MKKCLLFALALLFVSSAVYAQPPVGYIGLFADDARSSWCAYGTTPYYPVTMYIFCLPSVNGQFCAEFAIDYTDDPGIIKAGVTNNSHVSVALGDLATGMSVCFLTCQTDWHWAMSHSLFINTSSKREIRIVEHPGVVPPAVQFAYCPVGSPMEPCIILSSLFINSQATDPECLVLGNTPATWGAVKSLFAE